MVICSLVTTPQFMEEHSELLHSLLLSVQVEPVYAPEYEEQRMQKRTKLREAAAQRNQGPLLSLKRRLAAHKYSTTEEKINT